MSVFVKDDAKAAVAVAIDPAPVLPDGYWDYPYADTPAGAAARRVAPMLNDEERSRLCRKCGSLDTPLRDDIPVCDDFGLCDWRVDRYAKHAGMANPQKCKRCGMNDMPLTQDGACFMRKCVDDLGFHSRRLLIQQAYVREATGECGVGDCPRGPYDPPIPCKFRSECPVGK